MNNKGTEYRYTMKSRNKAKISKFTTQKLLWLFFFVYFFDLLE